MKPEEQSPTNTYEPQDLLRNLPQPFYVCQAREPHDVLYANEELLELLDCRDLAELRTHIGHRVSNMVALEGSVHIQHEVNEQLKARHDRFEHIHARIFTRMGRIRYVEFSGRLVRATAGSGREDVFYCLMTELERQPVGPPIAKDVRDYVVNHIDEAIEKHWIQIYYQPVIRTLTGNLCGFEALARWIDQHIGFLAPISFIPALEQTRQIYKLDHFILQEICRTAHQRLEKDEPVLPVSFNLSRLDFTLMDVFQAIEDTVAAYDLPRDLIHIEVTESAIARDPGPIRQTMDRLRAAGYEVWLDDFGSGYSSLNILKDCTVDLIKLDMGFLRNFTDKSRQIITSTIDMAKRLGIKTLTEGVETQEQADFLASIGCGRLQGYFFGKPQPLEGSFAHIASQDRGLESRKWHHYYDTASSVIRQTKSPLALIDFADDKVHYLYLNASYLEQLRGLHYDRSSAENALNAPKTNIYDTFREFLQIARQSGKRETYFYIDEGNYVRVMIEVVLESAGHALLLMNLKNITADHERLEHTKLDTNLRYLYQFFDSIHLIDFDADTIEPLFLHETPGADILLTKRHGWQALLSSFGQKHLHPDDRPRYEAYCSCDAFCRKLAAAPSGQLHDCFRVQDQNGNYAWKEFTAMLLPNTPGRRLLTTIQDIGLPALTMQTMLQESGEVGNVPAGMSLAALLWKNLQQNSRLCYFWKDRKRRFVGASKSFLAYYGFRSADAIIGKTDEDMGWHVDNGPYRDDEIAVIEHGRVIEKHAGQCIIRGVLHHITSYKWPIYQDGQIVGLMGMFFDIDSVLRERLKNARITYQDNLTHLMNRQGLLDALMRYEEQWQLHDRPYSLVLLGSRSYKRIADSYGEKVLKDLIRKKASHLRKLAGKDSAIARVTQSMFALVRGKGRDGEVEALTQHIIEDLEGIHEIDGNPVTITVQCGIAHSDEPGVSGENIYQTAFTRLQHALPKMKTNLKQ
ncbi:EAL domain-containing protein [uncultured Mitsuokella sp.]|uniref:bifunctional diguanylate cyclase/phosphodiesterase n=1 Tax=uncultured Mitsuokella sp. TaxID=453120 RepID=UPI0026DAFEA3|nr:EAL domain-containing protein [uncultured Mitsuokella sp.]